MGLEVPLSDGVIQLPEVIEGMASGFEMGDFLGDWKLTGAELLQRAEEKKSISERNFSFTRPLIAMLRPPDPDFFAWVVAAHYLNGIIAPLYPNLRPRDLVAALGVLDPDVVVSDNEDDTLQELIKQEMISLDPTGVPGLFVRDTEEFPRRRDAHRRGIPSRVDLILHSSGSTGRPKGILLAPDAYLRSARNFGTTLGLEPGAVYYCPLPMAHSGGLIMGFWAAVLAKAEFYTSTRVDFTAGADHLAEVQPDFVGAVDTFFFRWGEAVGGRHRLGTTAWSTGDESTLRRIEQACGFDHVVRPYGLTEASPNVGVGDPNRADSSGADARIWVHDGIDVQIRTPKDSSGGPTDEHNGLRRGEILVAGWCVARGYLTQDGITSVADDEGWIYTGDLGYIDDSGALYFTGRLKEMLKVGGLNVWPQEIESLLEEVEGMEGRYCVVGRPDDEYGEVPVLVVERKLAERRAALWSAMEALPRIKRPREILVWDALPQTPSGKMDRQAVTQRVADHTTSSSISREDLTADHVDRSTTTDARGGS